MIKDFRETKRKKWNEIKRKERNLHFKAFCMRIFCAYAKPNNRKTNSRNASCLFAAAFRWIACFIFMRGMSWQGVSGPTLSSNYGISLALVNVLKGFSSSVISLSIIPVHLNILNLCHPQMTAQVHDGHTNPIWGGFLRQSQLLWTVWICSCLAGTIHHKPFPIAVSPRYRFASMNNRTVVNSQNLRSFQPLPPHSMTENQ